MSLLVSLGDFSLSISIPMCWRQSLCFCANGLDNLQTALLKPCFLFSLQFLCSCLLVWLCRAHVALFLDNAVYHFTSSSVSSCEIALHVCFIHFAKESRQWGEERDRADTNAAFVSVFSKLSFPKPLNISFLRHSGLNVCQWIFDLGPEMNLKEISCCCTGVHSGWTHMKEKAASRLTREDGRVLTVIEWYCLWWANCKEEWS